MNVYKAYCDKRREVLASHSADFRRIFGYSLFNYVCEAGIIWLDWPRFFADIGIALGENSVAVMREKYGDEAVELITKLI